MLLEQYENHEQCLRIPMLKWAIKLSLAFLLLGTLLKSMWQVSLLLWYKIAAVCCFVWLVIVVRKWVRRQTKFRTLWQFLKIVHPAAHYYLILYFVGYDTWLNYQWKTMKHKDKSTMCTLCVLWYAKRHWSDAQQLKPQPYSFCGCQSVSQSVSQSVKNSSKSTATSWKHQISRLYFRRL